MAEAVTERVRRYILDGNDEDLRRLLGIAEISAEMARVAFRRLRVQQGWTAIDRGCGPTTQAGIAADRVDDLVRDIQAAKDGGYQWVSSPFYLDLTLRKTMAG